MFNELRLTFHSKCYLKHAWNTMENFRKITERIDDTGFLSWISTQYIQKLRIRHVSYLILCNLI